MWGLPVALIGIAPSIVVAVAAMLTIGVAGAILDISGFTLIQRQGTDRNLGRMFGVLFTFGIALGGLGTLIAPACESALGLRPGALRSVWILSRGRVGVALASASHGWPCRATVGGVLFFRQLYFCCAPLPQTKIEKIRPGRCETAEVLSINEGDTGDSLFLQGLSEARSRSLRGGVAQRTLGAGQSPTSAKKSLLRDVQQ